MSVGTRLLKMRDEKHLWHLEINVSSVPVMISILTCKSVSACLISSSIMDMKPWVPRLHLCMLELTAVRLHMCWLHNSSQELFIPLFCHRSKSCCSLQSSGSFSAYCWVSPSCPSKSSNVEANTEYIRGYRLDFSIQRQVTMKALVFLALLGAACKNLSIFVLYHFLNLFHNLMLFKSMEMWNILFFMLHLMLFQLLHLMIRS